MRIPGDTGHPWRLDKFIDYHALGDADMNFPILKLYADSMGLNLTNRFWLSFLYSCCYCVPTTCFLFERLDLDTITREQLDLFWERYKPLLIFQSDKKYVKNMNWFVTMVCDFIDRTQRSPSRYFKKFRAKDPQAVWNDLYKEINGWRYYGRFTAFLLIEAISELTPLKADSNWFDWKKGNTATSGMMNLLYMDKEADEFDATDGASLTSANKEKLDRALLELQAVIRQRYPNTSTALYDLETSLCGYRKLFKQSRYAGYYVDRGQEEIEKVFALLPRHASLWNTLWEYRKKAFNPLYLGEVQGWTGIRKKLCSQWVERGLTGVEAISKH